MSNTIRPAERGDHQAMLQLWHQGWHDAHAHLVPPDILAFRTPAHFADWLEQSEERFYVAFDHRIIGFVSVKDDELVKLYIDREARGSGIARTLLSHGEALLAANGVNEAILFCTADNVRAERFYRRQGWQLAETRPERLWLPEGQPGHYEVATHCFRKRLTPASE